MTDPVLSICVPTRNRAPYLRYLLDRLAGDMAGFPFPWEVFVSDNASTDETPSVIDAAAERLPLRWSRRSDAATVHENYHAAICAARGRYAVYLADDDFLFPDALAAAVQQLEDRPEAVGLYAPWTLYDLVRDRPVDQFYRQPDDVVIARGDYSALAEHVVGHRVFSEISIVRADVFRRADPVSLDHAFWAFVFPCEFLGYGDLIYAATPFYGSVTEHVVGGERAQNGFEEARTAWDKYRGGLEVLVGLAQAHGRMANPVAVRVGMERMLIDRMAVALRLRVSQGGDPIESYTLGARLRGAGALDKLTLPFESLRIAAAIHYAARLLPDRLGARRVLLLGDCPEETLATFRMGASVTVAAAADAAAIDADDVVILLGSEDAPPPEVASAALAALPEGDLLRKFP